MISGDDLRPCGGSPGDLEAGAGVYGVRRQTPSFAKRGNKGNRTMTWELLGGGARWLWCFSFPRHTCVALFAHMDDRGGFCFFQFPSPARQTLFSRKTLLSWLEMIPPSPPPQLHIQGNKPELNSRSHELINHNTTLFLVQLFRTLSLPSTHSSFYNVNCKLDICITTYLIYLTARLLSKTPFHFFMNWSN